MIFWNQLELLNQSEGMAWEVGGAYGCGLVGGLLFLMLLRPRTGSSGHANLALLLGAALVWHWACVVLPAALIVTQKTSVEPVDPREGPVAGACCLVVFSALSLW